MAAAADAPARAVAPAAQMPPKTRAATVSIVSNLILIALKVVAGVITGSIAIITEAIHSSIDLIASVIAFFSVRKADEPADASHLYGHEKVENLAAAIEGMLILFGAGIIVYEALPEHELAAVREAIERHQARELIGFHKLRARRAGSRRYVDLHVQFRDGTSLSRAHEVAHELQGEIRLRLRGADVLIHLEPEESVR